MNGKGNKVQILIDISGQIFRYCSCPMKSAFFSALIIGIIGHVDAIVGGIYNWDSVVSSPQGSGWLLAQGKWFVSTMLDLFGGRSYIPLKTITGILAIAFAAMLVVDLLEIKHWLWASIIGGMLAVFPATMCVNIYYVGAYFGAALLGVLSVWITNRLTGKWRWIIGWILIVLMLGVYPPYIGVAASLMILDLIKMLAENKISAKGIFVKGLLDLFQLIGGIAGYYLVLQILLKANGAGLYGYMNTDKMTQIDWASMPQLILEAYEKVFACFWNDAYGTGNHELIMLYRMTLLLLCVGVILLIICRSIYRDPLRCILFDLMVILFPLSVHLVAILDQGAGSHWLMMYPFVFVPVLSIWIVDYCSSIATEGVKAKFVRGQQLVTFVVGTLLVFMWTIVCNEGYLRTKLCYENAYATLTDITEDIFDTEGFNSTSKIAFIGTTNFRKQEYLQEYDNYTGVANPNFVSAYDGTMERFTQTFLGIDFDYATAEEKEMIKEESYFMDMESYPYNGYIQNVNGTIVVKLSD